MTDRDRDRDRDRANILILINNSLQIIFPVLAELWPAGWV